jgi:hypothetical protein
LDVSVGLKILECIAVAWSGMHRRHARGMLERLAHCGFLSVSEMCVCLCRRASPPKRASPDKCRYEASTAGSESELFEFVERSDIAAEMQEA